MEQTFSQHWKSSKSPRKQRKYRYNAPLHIKRKFLAAHLSKDLIKKYARRSVIVRKGDRVLVMRGSFKKKTAKVTRVDIKQELVYLEGVEFTKKDGNKVQLGVHPSNLTITELVTDDKYRLESLNKNVKKDKTDKSAAKGVSK